MISSHLIYFKEIDCSEVRTYSVSTISNYSSIGRSEKS